MRDKTKQAAYNKEWVQNNRERARELWRTNKAKHRALIPKKIRIAREKKDIRTYKERAQYMREYQKRYKSLRKEFLSKIPGKFTKNDIKAKLLLQENKCVYCTIDITLIYEKDHIQPLSKGGTNHLENIQMVCPTCNRKKYNKYPFNPLLRLI